jgi:hypothetical protein
MVIAGPNPKPAAVMARKIQDPASYLIPPLEETLRLAAKAKTPAEMSEMRRKALDVYLWGKNFIDDCNSLLVHVLSDSPKDELVAVDVAVQARNLVMFGKLNPNTGKNDSLLEFPSYLMGQRPPLSQRLDYYSGLADEFKGKIAWLKAYSLKNGVF